jgi:hypothetical protein
MDAVPSMAPTARTGVEPAIVAGAPIGLTLSASWDRGASDLVDNQARSALAEIVAAAGLGIPTDGACERAAAEEPTTRVTANARHVVGNCDHDRSRVEIRPPRDRAGRDADRGSDRKRADRPNRLARRPAQRKTRAHDPRHRFRAIEHPPTERLGPRRPSERGDGPYRQTHDGNAHSSARRIATPGQHGTFRLTRFPVCDDEADGVAARRVEVRHSPRRTIAEAP